MAYSRLRFGLVCLLLLAGCKSQPYVNAHIESVNTEYRQLEDYVYALEAENARLQQELAALSSPTGKANAPSQSTPARGVPSRSPAGSRPRLPSSPDTEPGIEGPVIELPDAPPPRSGPRSMQRPAFGSPSELTDPADTPPNITPSASSIRTHEEQLPMPSRLPAMPGPTMREVLPAKPADMKVTHLSLNTQFTSGIDLDGQPGDDGLRIVLEPRNTKEEFVPQSGAVSVVVLDPSRQGETSRIARWDFDSSAMEQKMADSRGRGIQLELPWPSAAPLSERVAVFVRYETEDGRRLETSRDVFLTAGSQASSGWTPRSAEKEPPPRLAQKEAAPLRRTSSDAIEATTKPAWSPDR